MMSTISYSVSSINNEDIYNFLVENDGLFNPSFSTNVNLKEYSQKLYKYATIYEAWSDDKKLIGILAAYLNKDSKRVYIPYICTTCKGIGTSLFSYMLSNINDYNYIELEVKKSNERAFRFYEKLGFYITAENNNKIQMKKDIHNNNPLVSICCVTYNQAPYIRECLDGFIMQKTDFAYEILIHDDASTDETAAIIREYKLKYPNIIKPIYQVENQYSKGISPTRKFNIPRAKGKYLAFCEGDDYWTDPLKLQKQVDSLEANPEYGLVWSKANIYYDEEKKTRGTTGSNAETFEELLYANNIPTLTALFKKECLIGYDECIKGNNWKMGDYPMWLYIASKSKIHFIDEITAVYRVLENSASHSSSYEKKRDFIISAYDIRLFFAKWAKKDIKDIERIESRKNRDLFTYAVLRQKYNDAIAYFKEIDSADYRMKDIARYMICIIKNNVTKCKTTGQ